MEPIISTLCHQEAYLIGARDNIGDCALWRRVTAIAKPVQHLSSRHASLIISTV